MNVLASNKKAYFNFEILESFLAGISLYGWESKAIKQSRISLNGSYIKNINSELFLEGSVISPLKYAGNIPEIAKKRSRKLLLTKKQIRGILEVSKLPGNTIVPLEIVQSDKGLVKVEIALVKGRKKFDKRELLKKGDIDRSIQNERKKYNI